MDWNLAKIRVFPTTGTPQKGRINQNRAQKNRLQETISMPSLPCWSFWGPFLLLVFLWCFCGKESARVSSAFFPLSLRVRCGRRWCGNPGCVCFKLGNPRGFRSESVRVESLLPFLFLLLSGRGGDRKLFSCLSLSLSFLSLPGGRERWPAGTWFRIRQNSSEKIKLLNLPKKLFLLISTCFVHIFFKKMKKQF